MRNKIKKMLIFEKIYFFFWRISKMNNYRNLELSPNIYIIMLLFVAMRYFRFLLTFIFNY